MPAGTVDIGTGALNLRVPTGGWANGIPSHLSVPLDGRTPRNVPDVVWTTGLVGAAHDVGMVEVAESSHRTRFNKSVIGACRVFRGAQIGPRFDPALEL